MNILIVNQYAGSSYHGMEYRHFNLASEWVAMGHQVNIVTGSFSHQRLHNMNINTSCKTERINDILYTWLKIPSYSKNGLKRGVSMLTFFFQVNRMLKRIADKFNPDVMIASCPSPLEIFPVYRVAKRINSKIVYEVRDLWPITLIELGDMSKFHPFIMMLQAAEDFACRNSDIIVSMLPCADIHLCTRGMELKKYFYIPNGVILDSWHQDAITQPPEKVKHILERLRSTNSFLVGYAGAHSVANCLGVLIEAANLLLNKEIVVVLIGSGAEKIALQEKAKKEGINNVIFLDPIDKNAIPYVLGLFDALYIGWQRKHLYRYGISPNKLMDYLMAEKPVIHAIEAANDLVAESGCGISCEPENPQAIAEAILKLKNMPEEKRKEMGLMGRQYVEEHHDYRILAKRFLEAIQ